MNAHGAATGWSKKAAFPNGETFFYVQLIGAGSRVEARDWHRRWLSKCRRGREMRESQFIGRRVMSVRRVYEKLGFEEVGEMIWWGQVP